IGVTHAWPLNTNPTSLPDYYDSLETVKSALNIFSMIVYSVTFFLGLAGNGLVIWVAGFHMARTVNTVWYLNLAVADFIIILSLPLQLIMVALHYHCTVSLLNLLVSVFLLTLISMDRCVAILWPVWSRNHRTPAKAAVAASGAWLLAVSFSIPYSLFKETVVLEGVTYCYNKYDLWNETQGSYWLWKEIIIPRYQTLVTSRFVFGFILPVAVITSCYILVALRLRERKLARSISLWLDFVSSQEDREDLDKVAKLVGPLASSMAFINSCLNPVLYVFIGHDFWERLLRSLPAALERALSEEPDRSLNPSSQTSPL
uniref:N-formyl peptide receptor 2 n=1 Tax=Prolemur simus TaxID=1328070 RepID=A0A8C9DMF2_PROSS